MQAQMVPEQSQRVSPTLIMVNQLLALSSIELQHVVRSELEQNPALESVESNTCTSCGAGTRGNYCPVCLQPMKPTGGADRQALRMTEQATAGPSGDDGYDPEDFRSREHGVALMDEEFDPMTLVASEASMAEQLLADIRASLPPEDHYIAEYLVGNLDEQGFL